MHFTAGTSPPAPPWWGEGGEPPRKVQDDVCAAAHLGTGGDQEKRISGLRRGSERDCDKFPKHIYHSIVCVGALVAHRDNGGPWMIDALGAPHACERPEKALIASFVDRIAELSPPAARNGSKREPPLRPRGCGPSLCGRGKGNTPGGQRQAMISSVVRLRRADLDTSIGSSGEYCEETRG